MDDFSTPGKVNSYGVPASPSNYIAPGKMPLSSMCPLIILDKNGDVKLLIGGAGGIKITSSVAYVSELILYYLNNLIDSFYLFRLLFVICTLMNPFGMLCMHGEFIINCFLCGLTMKRVLIQRY